VLDVLDRLGQPGWSPGFSRGREPAKAGTPTPRPPSVGTGTLDPLDTLDPLVNAWQRLTCHCGRPVTPDPSPRTARARAPARGQRQEPLAGARARTGKRAEGRPCSI